MKSGRWISRTLTHVRAVMSGDTLSLRRRPGKILEEALEPFHEDMKRHLRLGLETEALEICKGLVLGCYRLSERAGGDVLGWAPDFPAEAVGHALEVWYSGSDDPQNRKGRKKRPPLPADFQQLVPKWISLIGHVGKEKK